MDMRVCRILFAIASLVLVPGCDNAVDESDVSTRIAASNIGNAPLQLEALSAKIDESVTSGL